MNCFGEKIKSLRELNHMNQQELALKVRVGPGTIEKYEAGTQLPDIQTILKLSTVLDVPASDLLNTSDLTSTPLDKEILHLTKELGMTKTKMILSKSIDLNEEEFSMLLHWFQDLKKKHPVH